MAFLLDTHAFLWFVSGDKKIPKSVKDIISNINESCYLSAASLWEITIKLQIGKLKLGVPLNELFEFVTRNQIEVIPINFEHLITLAELPKNHTDPFDRIIISQAIVENLEIITKDKEFKKYDTKIKWK
jgi:PIN domain nuclease of toxin-antitoxin system